MLCKQKYIKIKVSSLATAFFLAVPVFSFSVWIAAWNLSGGGTGSFRYENAVRMFLEISSVVTIFLAALAFILSIVSLFSKGDASEDSGEYKWDRYEDGLLFILSLGLFGVLLFMMV